jgi:hypothetical protein
MHHDVRADSLCIVIEIGNRMRNQPAPPHVVREALLQPDRDPSRAWLALLDDEQRPRIGSGDSHVTWSALWLKRPDAVIDFELQSSGGGTGLRWRLYVDEPRPDAALIGHLRKRVNEIINADLRFSFGN